MNSSVLTAELLLLLLLLQAMLFDVKPLMYQGPLLHTTSLAATLFQWAPSNTRRRVVMLQPVYCKVCRG